MRPIRLPEPPGVDGMETPEIFSGGGSGAKVVRRAVLIGNGSPGAENQCLGLARALGLADNLTLYRVTRPRGGINEWLHFLPISLHKFIDQVLRQFFRNTRFTIVVQGRKPYRVLNSSSVGLSTILEPDVKKIVTVARETYEKEGPTLVVACGWDTISYSSLIRKLASDNVFVIQIQHPRSRLDRFDLVVTPRHDYYALTASGQQEIPRLFRRWITPQEPPRSNVVLTVGALHQADSAALRLAAIAWHDELAPLPKPLLVVNIGGPTRNCKYGIDLAKHDNSQASSQTPWDLHRHRASTLSHLPPTPTTAFLSLLQFPPNSHVSAGRIWFRRFTSWRIHYVKRSFDREHPTLDNRLPRSVRAARFTRSLTATRLLSRVRQIRTLPTLPTMFKRSFTAAPSNKDRAGKVRKVSKRSFRDDAKQRLREQLAQATPDTSPSLGSCSPSLNSAIVTITVGPERRLFAAHEEVLARSPVLADACRAQFFEPSGERRIELPDEEPVVFAAVLEFLYKREYTPRLLKDVRRDSWYLEDDDDALTTDLAHPDDHRPSTSRSYLKRPSAAESATIYHHVAGDYILRDTVIYCTALRLQLPDLQRLALRKQGLVHGLDCATVLRSARFAYAHTPASDARLRAHYLALIIRGRRTFKRSGTLQMEMEKGGSPLFFDVFVAMCNHIEDLTEGREQLLQRDGPSSAHAAAFSSRILK